MNLGRINIPTLVVANIDDQCNITPEEGADEISSLLVNAKTVEVKKFNGGSKPKSKPCKAMSYHGFLGLEKEVVNYISIFLNQIKLFRKACIMRLERFTDYKSRLVMQVNIRHLLD